MPQIGTFTREQSGSTGRVQTFTIYREITVVPAEPSDTENAPDYRIHHGNDEGPEIGAFEVTGGSSTAGTIGGDAGEAGSASTSSASAADGPPAWAKRMKRSQQFTHGVQAAAHSVRSGDSHGGGSSINLSESDR